MGSDYPKPKKKRNGLSIRLTESAVFLPTDGTPNRRGSTVRPDRNAMLRGLLILDLVKPTKITSIDVELSATTSTAWPEGIGARRIDITEEHCVFHAYTSYFNAGKTDSTRRTSSIGPGVSYYDREGMEADLDDDFDGPDWDDIRAHLPQTHERTLDAARSRSRSRRDLSRSNSGNAQAIQAESAGPSTYTDSQLIYPQGPPSCPTTSVSTGASTSTAAPGRPFPISRYHARRSSVDNSHFQRMPIYETNPEQDGNTPISPNSSQLEQMGPIPPYSLLPTSPPISSPSSPLSPTAAAQSLEEFRNSLHSNLRNSQLYQSQTNLSSSTGSLHSTLQRERSLSQHPSLSDVIPENLELEQSTPRVSTPARSPSNRPLGEGQPGSNPRMSLPLELENVAPTSSPPSSPTLSGGERGRRRSRFSLSSVSSILMDAVRPSSAKRGDFRASLERTSTLGLGRDRSADRGPRASSDMARGRTMERGVSGSIPEGWSDAEPPASEGEQARTRAGRRESGSRMGASRERGRGVLGRIMKEKEKGSKDKAEGWKEFKKGTYSYPISFSIPSNAPPSMRCDFGSVVWRLKASVHRPGTFKAKITSCREVVTIACPTEEDTEDTENIIVERHWEQQLQYLISISGRSFYIGGTVPVTLTFMPLMKVKIHRLSVVIEERVDYYTQMRRIARTDPITRYTLLSIKGEGKVADPILPLESDSPDALRNSPLFPLVDPHSTDAELSEAASSLMGPGPWTFHQNLQLPKSCQLMRFTNRNRRSNIIITHLLKVIMRVERGDDLHLDGKTGSRKLFDIVVQTPIIILSCRCNPQWTALPRYAEAFDDSTAIVPSCPCQVARERAGLDHRGGFHVSAALERITSRHSSNSSLVSAAEGNPIIPSAMLSLRQLHYNESILQSNSLFERLISGQESESGEAPPAYDTYSTPSIPSSSRNPHPLVSVVPIVQGVAAL
ncbi:hypothetical protein M413DRAFT_11761 [Hebeloma cylindrosporum]|uniref:Arrestin C-terminal-like domain-containing protein n=1 Tax=Hebeloma cylindrosporum TaxID=76867 RepID=A0A0C2YGT0_HEBCY|nr:hypothetical protein M413DRAFT_11761 [Hebeloma cylindrosporum h7]